MELLLTTKIQGDSVSWDLIKIIKKDSELVPRQLVPGYLVKSSRKIIQ